MSINGATLILKHYNSLSRQAGLEKEVLFENSLFDMISSLAYRISVCPINWSLNDESNLLNTLITEILFNKGVHKVHIVALTVVEIKGGELDGRTSPRTSYPRCIIERQRVVGWRLCLHDDSDSCLS